VSRAAVNPSILSYPSIQISSARVPGMYDPRRLSSASSCVPRKGNVAVSAAANAICSKVPLELQPGPLVARSRIVLGKESAERGRKSGPRNPDGLIRRHAKASIVLAPRPRPRVDSPGIERSRGATGRPAPGGEGRVLSASRFACRLGLSAAESAESSGLLPELPRTKRGQVRRACKSPPLAGLSSKVIIFGT